MKNTAVYAGTFDPCTFGHKHVIEKAANVFDTVYVVIADNPAKNPVFSVEDRLKMLAETCYGIPNVFVTVVEGKYTAKFAQEKNAVLVRGIRNNMDHSHETDIYRTNRQIAPDVETFYLMPDDMYSLVSSSWIKGLVGPIGWRDIVSSSVSLFVFHMLKEDYLRREYSKLEKSGVSWDEIKKSYSDRPYHNYDHIIDLLQGIEKFWKQKFGDEVKDLIKIAIFLHDLEDTVEKTIDKIAFALDEHGCGEFVHKMILATTHESDQYRNEVAALMASIDLLVLGKTLQEYNQYVKTVQEEYRLKGFSAVEWVRGRREFLEKFVLSRENVYPYPEIRSVYEAQARSNIQIELTMLQSDFLIPLDTSAPIKNVESKSESLEVQG